MFDHPPSGEISEADVAEVLGRWATRLKTPVFYLQFLFAKHADMAMSSHLVMIVALLRNVRGFSHKVSDVVSDFDEK